MSLNCLDRQRLGKQRVEAFQILKALQYPNYGWQNHPAVNMWRGYEPALTEYYNTSLLAWAARGYNSIKLQPIVITEPAILPPWIGDEAFHSSHRSNLLRKNFAYYSALGWTDDPEAPYIWPTQSL